MVGPLHWRFLPCHLRFGQLGNAICKIKLSEKSNIIAYIHTNRIHKYLSVRTKRSNFPRFSLLVPNSQERSSPKKLASMGGKIWARLAPSHLAEEISAGYVIERHTYIGTVTGTCSSRRFTGGGANVALLCALPLPPQAPGPQGPTGPGRPH